MSTDEQVTTTDEAETGAAFDTAELAELRERVGELGSSMADRDDGDGQKKMVIVATQVSLDMAYPPLILGSTAAAFVGRSSSSTCSGDSTFSTRRNRKTSN